MKYVLSYFFIIKLYLKLALLFQEIVRTRKAMCFSNNKTNNKYFYAYSVLFAVL